MDAATQAAVARALDRSIAYVAEKEVARLSRGLSDRRIALRICGALSSLRDLAEIHKMPCYDAWDALFYLTWYQPRQINLAYTLVREILKVQNPFEEGRDNLQVIDFACGALAMQFGLALAGAKIRDRRGRCPKIAIVSTDKSDHMRRIGKRMWRRFIEEIADEDKYPRLEDLQQVCSAMKIRKRHKRTAATRWLTALHVAYEENFGEVEAVLDEEVGTWEPDVVLVTHTMANRWAYSPYDRDAYQEHQRLPSVDGLAPFEGRLKATTEFRERLYNSYSGMIDRIADSQADREISYFLSNPVSWNPAKTTHGLYVRQ